MHGSMCVSALLTIDFTENSLALARRPRHRMRVAAKTGEPHAPPFSRGGYLGVTNLPMQLAHHSEYRS